MSLYSDDKFAIQRTYGTSGTRAGAERVQQRCNQAKRGERCYWLGKRHFHCRGKGMNGTTAREIVADTGYGSYDSYTPAPPAPQPAPYSYQPYEYKPYSYTPYSYEYTKPEAKQEPQPKDAPLDDHRWDGEFETYGVPELPAIQELPSLPELDTGREP